MKLVAKTDIGSQRSENQDSYRGGRRPDDAVWGAVCDGMGGARGGRLASTMAVDALQQAIEAGIDEAHTPQAGRALLESAVEQANRSVYEKARGTPSLSGMGTTVVCALVRGGLAQYVHVGDSRIYLFRNNKLLQLTKDHSMVQEMVEQGALTEEEAQNHPRKNLITRAVGTEPRVSCDVFTLRVAPGDAILLCSDGLSNLLTDQELLFEVVHAVHKEQCCQHLIEIAKDRGAPDNITAVLMLI